MVIILALLAVLVLINKFYLSKKSESTFNDEFLKLDTSAVVQISIFPKAENGKEIKITKEAVGWMVQKEKIKVKADSSAVRGFIGTLAYLKSNSLASSDKSGWKELQVDDSSGNKLSIMTSDNKTYGMVVGKFSYNPASQGGMTYIRHSNEESVYAIDGFLSFNVNQPFSAWRIKTFILGNKSNWKSLTFSYPGDSSFVITGNDPSWMINGAPADSTKTNEFLNTLQNLPNNSFADEYKPSSTPVYSLTIQGNNQQSPVVIQAYPADSVQHFYLHSSLNPDVYFSDNQNLAQRIFIGKSKLLP
jgi:hypothetical protein